MTSPLGTDGPAGTVTTAVPDLHHFRGSFGGKDVIPLYRDAAAQQLNVTAGLPEAVTNAHRPADPAAPAVTGERLFAYTYAILAGTDYTHRFAAELQTPGPRVPLTADPALFGQMADLGEHLLWLHTFAERHQGPTRGRYLPHAGVTWSRAVTQLPASLEEVTYDAGTHELAIGTGALTGIHPEVYTFTVSGFPVVRRWIGSRTLKGVGRSATRPTYLDLRRPRRWYDEWNSELLDLLRALTATLDLQADGTDLLTAILTAPTLRGADLPAPTAQQRRPPPVDRVGLLFS